MDKQIVIAGAREHNLKNITVTIPRNKITIVTGLSGSGKSSLAFDTLYAEGQRRYVESLSAYARQFLDQMQKPDVDYIDGLSPAISIEQKTAGSNPRSIVATSTEILDYLRLLFASIGERRCPKCGKKVGRMSAEQMVDELMTLPVRTKIAVLAPLIRGRKGKHEDIADLMRKNGFVRTRVNGKIYDLEDFPQLNGKVRHDIEAVVDRLIITSKVKSRLTDSVETALKHGMGIMLILSRVEGGIEKARLFSEKNACPDCNISFEELAPRNFSFNSPYGACPKCSGLGTMLVLDEDLIVPNPNLSIEKGAVQAWRRGGRRLIIYYKGLLRALAAHYKFSLEIPFNKLPAKIRQIIFYGSGEEPVTYGLWRGGSYKKISKPFEGVVPNLMRRYETTDSEFTQQRLRSYMSRQKCTECGGARLKPEVIACLVSGKSIVDVMKMSVQEADKFFNNMKLSDKDAVVVAEILKEIRRRLAFLMDVGLDYLTLDRESGTLSGGEAQRIRLATQIGSGLVGVLYVLDEPTIGLHQRDNGRLISTLKGLSAIGNTVVVVEHDEETIRSADYVIDLGPGAGRNGGYVVFQGDVENLLASQRSLTARYMKREAGVSVPASRVSPKGVAIKIVGAAENNLKDIDVSIPLGLFVCVTGVSGSGKSTLIDEILRKALFRHFYASKERPGKYKKITGLDKIDKVILIDQSPIGRTPRSNPATYTGAFTDIRNLFSQTQAARVRGYEPGRFSFNVKGGRCETCKGDGIIRLEMHFLPDVYVTCEQCRGMRYNAETLEIRYGGKNIAEVLAMTVDEARDFFANIPVIDRKIRTLSEVGLGYLQLGQSATTLSGGEAQRVKLSSELSKKATGRTLYLLDEPTTGLHFADTHNLLNVLLRLRDSGNTVVVIEHNMDVIKTADYIIDLGPEGGNGGGRVVVEGTPEQVARCAESHTGAYLKKYIFGGEISCVS